MYTQNRVKSQKNRVNKSTEKSVFDRYRYGQSRHWDKEDFQTDRRVKSKNTQKMSNGKWPQIDWLSGQWGYHFLIDTMTRRRIQLSLHFDTRRWAKEYKSEETNFQNPLGLQNKVQIHGVPNGNKYQNDQSTNKPSHQTAWSHHTMIQISKSNDRHPDSLKKWMSERIDTEIHCQINWKGIMQCIWVCP